MHNLQPYAQPATCVCAVVDNCNPTAQAIAVQQLTEEIERNTVTCNASNPNPLTWVPHSWYVVVRNRRELTELQATISGDLYTITKGL